MPSLAQHKSQRIVKLLAIGDSGAGKTGALISLVMAGYKLRILDYDSKLAILYNLIMELCPEKINNVEFRSLRDRRKPSALGPVIDGNPRAFADGLKMLDRWRYKTPEGDEVDLGTPSKWGANCILVMDSLSRFCDAAYDFREPLTPVGKSGEADPRATYGDAQDAVENTLGMLTADTFATNVIVICHGQYMDLPDGTKKIFPQGVGKALSPKIPQYFPTYIRFKNLSGKRTIQLKSDAMIDLANGIPSGVPDSLPVETGLATYFELLRGPLTEEEIEDDTGRREPENLPSGEPSGTPQPPDGEGTAYPDPGPAPSPRKFQPLTKFTRR